MDFLFEAYIVPTLKAATKKQVLQEVARRAAAATGLEESAIFLAMLERERLGSTGIGHGIAIPHARVAGLDRVVGLFARLERPVPFDAIDNRPVDLVFLLLSPPEAGADHLRALARVSRTLRDEGLTERLRGATTVDAVAALLLERVPLTEAA